MLSLFAFKYIKPLALLLLTTYSVSVSLVALNERKAKSQALHELEVANKQLIELQQQRQADLNLHIQELNEQIKLLSNINQQNQERALQISRSLDRLHKLNEQSQDDYQYRILKLNEALKESKSHCTTELLDASIIEQLRGNTGATDTKAP